MYVTAYPVLKNVKKIKLSPPKPGCMYPCLSDIEAESEVQESETEDFENNRCVLHVLTFFSNSENLLNQIIYKLILIYLRPLIGLYP